MTIELTEQELTFIHRALKFFIRFDMQEGFTTQQEASLSRDVATKIWGLLNDAREAKKSGVL